MMRLQARYHISCAEPIMLSDLLDAAKTKKFPDLSYRELSE